MKGKINVYSCTCGHRMVTIDREDGTTPGGMRCKGRRCHELAWSNWYAAWCQVLTPTHEFIRPDAATYAKLDGPARDHVDQGGLILRRIRKEAADA